MFSRIFKRNSNVFYFLVEAMWLNLINWFSILYMVKFNPWVIQRRKNIWICLDGFLMCRHFQKSEAIDQKYHLVGICCIESLYAESVVTYEKNALFHFNISLNVNIFILRNLLLFIYYLLFRKSHFLREKKLVICSRTSSLFKQHAACAWLEPARRNSQIKPEKILNKHCTKYLVETT